jgi:hypothetical protein
MDNFKTPGAGTATNKAGVMEREAFPFARFSEPPHKGELVRYDVALKCAKAYVSIMAEHGFRLAAGQQINLNVPYSRMVTYSEDFVGPEVLDWLKQTYTDLQQGDTSTIVYTQLVMGFYTDDIIDDPASELPGNLKEAKRNRSTIFIIPFTHGARKGLLGTPEHVYDFGGLQP